MPNFASSSPLMIGLTIAFFVVACIVTADKRRTQSAWVGDGPPPNAPPMPQWVAWLFTVEWLLKAALIILNWRYGLLLYVIGFGLASAGVLEIIGGLMLSPFLRRR